MSVSIYDCRGTLAPDARIGTDLDAGEVRTAFGLDLSVSETQTEADGLVILVNVPTGQMTLSAIPVVLGRPSSEVTVNVQANTLTEVLMYPTP